MIPWLGERHRRTVSGFSGRFSLGGGEVDGFTCRCLHEDTVSWTGGTVLASRSRNPAKRVLVSLVGFIPVIQCKNRLLIVRGQGGPEKDFGVGGFLLQHVSETVSYQPGPGRRCLSRFLRVRVGEERLQGFLARRDYV